MNYDYLVFTGMTLAIVMAFLQAKRVFRGQGFPENISGILVVAFSLYASALIPGMAGHLRPEYIYPLFLLLSFLGLWVLPTKFRPAEIPPVPEVEKSRATLID